MTPPPLVNRASQRHVALETSLLVQGLPRDSAERMTPRLRAAIEEEESHAAVVGVLAGRAIVGMSDDEVVELIETPGAAKATASNLGALLYAGRSAGTTVSATIELAWQAGVAVFATGAIGGVHAGYGERLDISSDLAMLVRRPMIVVCSGAKCTLDVEATREALESLGVVVVGVGTDAFPGFYLSASERDVDIRLDDPGEVAAFAQFEMARTGRSVLVVQPPPENDVLSPEQWSEWRRQAESRVAETGAVGPHATPALLAALHEVSGGATLRVNEALIEANARLAGAVCRHLSKESSS